MTTASRRYVSYLAGRREENEAVGRCCCYGAPATVVERKRRGQRVPLFSPQSDSRMWDSGAEGQRAFSTLAFHMAAFF